jgi:hypothetical protein
MKNLPVCQCNRKWSYGLGDLEEDVFELGLWETSEGKITNALRLTVSRTSKKLHGIVFALGTFARYSSVAMFAICLRLWEYCCMPNDIV